MKKKIAIIGMTAALLVLIMCSASTVAAKEDAVSSIALLNTPSKCAYNIGDPYSTDGMTVEATLADGKKVKVDNSQVTSSVDGAVLTQGRPFTTEGWKNVIVNYQGKTTSYGIAVFNPSKNYYIKYNSNGGNAINSDKINASTKEFKLPIPKKSGYKFLGWYHSNGYKYTKYTPGMGPSLEFTAKWERVLVYNANGGKGKMANATISQNYKLPKSGFKKSGYKFVGWSQQKTVTKQQNFYEVEQISTLIDPAKATGNVTLYAQWVKSATYKITYGSLKRIEPMKRPIKNYKSGKVTVLPMPMAKDDAYNFVGWSITKGGKNYGVYMDIPPYMQGNIKLTPYLVKFVG